MSVNIYRIISVIFGKNAARALLLFQALEKFLGYPYGHWDFPVCMIPTLFLLKKTMV